MCCFFHYSDSDESDGELHTSSTRCSLMHKSSLEEGILFELEREHQLKVKVLFLLKDLILNYAYPLISFHVNQWMVEPSVTCLLLININWTSCTVVPQLDNQSCGEGFLFLGSDTSLKVSNGDSFLC